jgi:hypothetical protein
VAELILLSNTISLQVLASSQVVNNLEVVTTTGYLSLGDIKLSNSAFHSLSSQVIFITYL